MKSKKQIIVHIGYSISSIGGNVLCKQLRYIKNKYTSTHDIVLILSNLKTDKRRETVEALSGITFSKVILAYDHWKTVFPKGIYKYSSWESFYLHENWFDDLKNVDKIYLFGGLINCQMLRKEDGLNKAIRAGRFLKFASASCYIATVLQLLKYSNTHRVEMNEVVYDPQETSLDTIELKSMKPRFHKLWFCYDIPAIKARRLDYLRDMEEDAKPSKKVNDFCFGSTFVSKHRYAFYEKILPILDYFKNSRTFIYHNKKDINTVVPHSEYQQHIAESRFTMIIPSYDTKTFSMIRFYEALSRDCLPLIYEDTYVEDLKNSFDLDENILREITISSNINSFSVISEARRLELLTYLQNKIISHD